jgi:hypothetical protein
VALSHKAENGMVRNYNDTLMTLAGAMQAIGGTAAARLVWLEDFERRDLSAVTVREVAAVELRAFVMQYAIGIHHFGIFQGLEIDADNVTGIRDALRAFLAEIGTPATSQSIVAAAASTLISPLPRGLAPIAKIPSIGAVVTAVSALLLDIGPRLGRCDTPTCGRLFAGAKVSQKRCRANCGVTERVRDWRNKNREKVREGQHQRYVRKVKTVHPKARVERRARKAKGGA